MSTILRQSLLIAAKDSKIFIRDRFALGFALLFPIVFAIGFSFGLAGVGPSNERVEFTIVTLEQDGGISHQIIEALTAAPDSAVRILPYEDALRAVEDGELAGFLAFPGNFTSNVMSGQPTELEVVAHADAPATQAALEGIGRSIAGRLTNVQTTLQAVIELRASAGRSWPPPERPTLFDQKPLVSFQTSRLGDSIPFNPSNFVLTGYVTMFVFFAAAMGAGAVVRERQNQTLERLLSNGVRRDAVIVGKFLAAIYKGLLQIVVLWTFGIFVFQIDLGLAPGAVILISLLVVLVSSGFGVMLASLVQTERSGDSAGVLASLVMAPIGGCWWPLFITPAWMQSLAKLTPHGWANTGFNKLMLFGAEFGDVLLEMAALIVFALAFVAVALWRFRLSPGR